MPSSTDQSVPLPDGRGSCSLPVLRRRSDLAPRRWWPDAVIVGALMTVITSAELRAQVVGRGAEPRCDSALSALHLVPAVLHAIHETLDGHDGVVVRWAQRSDEPIRVWIQPSSLRIWSLEHPLAPTQAVHRALSVWSTAVGIQLSPTNDSAAADVHVLWEQPHRSPENLTSGSRAAATTTLQGVRAAGRITGARVHMREASSSGTCHFPRA